MLGVQAELGKLAAMLADKENELKVTQKDLEAKKDEVMRMTQELGNRDRSSFDLEVSTPFCDDGGGKLFLPGAVSSIALLCP